MASTQFLIATLLLFSLMHAGSTLKCYECAEDKGRNGVCKNDRGVENATVDCVHSCITQTIGSSSGGEMVLKVCAEPSYCQHGAPFLTEKLGIKTKSCTPCNSDLCN